MEDTLKSTAVFLSDELIVEIISCLPVKPLMRFRCLNKSFNTLISDTYFVKKHLKKSKQNPHLTVNLLLNPDNESYVLTFPISSLLENSLTTIRYDPYYRLKNSDYSWHVVGSCNGLLCLIHWRTSPAHLLLCLWNPATRTKSEFVLAPHNYRKFFFGYDSLTETYKLVAFRVGSDEDNRNTTGMVKVLSIGGNNSWRNIQRLLLPLYWFQLYKNGTNVHLNGTISWLALRNYFDVYCPFVKDSPTTVEEYVIVSLDLSTESHTQLLLPQGFDEVPIDQPTLAVLMDCLCFSYDFKETHYVIWQMKDFGVHESWIQLFKISYLNLEDYGMKFRWFTYLPLHLSENGDTLILANGMNEAIVYNGRDNTRVKIGITNEIVWPQARDYVESLVSIR